MNIFKKCLPIVASMLSVFALFFANTSTTMCAWLVVEEPEMPESLIITD